MQNKKRSSHSDFSDGIEHAFIAYNEILLISLFQTHNDGKGQCQCSANFVQPNIISDIPNCIVSRSNKYQIIGSCVIVLQCEFYIIKCVSLFTFYRFQAIKLFYGIEIGKK